MELVIKLKVILKERNIEQKELAAMTDLTERAISELCNNKVERIPKTSLVKIAKALELKNISDLLEFKE